MERAVDIAHELGAGDFGARRIVARRGARVDHALLIEIGDVFLRPMAGDVVCRQCKRLRAERQRCGEHGGQNSFFQNDSPLANGGWISSGQNLPLCIIVPYPARECTLLICANITNAHTGQTAGLSGLSRRARMRARPLPRTVMRSPTSTSRPGFRQGCWLTNTSPFVI